MKEAKGTRQTSRSKKMLCLHDGHGEMQGAAGTAESHAEKRNRGRQKTSGVSAHDALSRYLPSPRSRNDQSLFLHVLFVNGSYCNQLALAIHVLDATALLRDALGNMLLGCILCRYAANKFDSSSPNENLIDTMYMSFSFSLARSPIVRD